MAVALASTPMRRFAGGKEGAGVVEIAKSKGFPLEGRRKPGGGVAPRARHRLPAVATNLGESLQDVERLLRRRNLFELGRRTEKGGKVLLPGR
jgi:hypothetical protein